MSDQRPTCRKPDIVMRVRTCLGCGSVEEGSWYGLSAVPADCWRCPGCQCTTFEMVAHSIPG